MGKTKIKIVDDSQPVEEKKPKKVGKPKPFDKTQGRDELVEKLKAELGLEEAPKEEEQKVEKRMEKPDKTKPRGKKYQEAVKDLDRSKSYSVTEAVDMVKKLSYSKFTGTLEAHINTVPKAAVIHRGLGKLNQPAEELSAKVKALLQTVGKTKIKKVTLSPTMGPSVKVDLSSL